MIRRLRPRLAMALVIGLAMAGCQVPAPASSVGGAVGPQRLAVLGGAVTVAAPRGYCIDTAASRDDGNAAVVLIGRCRTDASARAAAVLTVTVGQGGSAGVLAAGGPALAAFFTSTAGRAVLARSGRASDVRVVQARGRGEAFVMQLADRQVGVYWRAVTGIRGRLITVSATGTDGAALSPEAGLPLVDATLAALRAGNPGVR